MFVKRFLTLVLLMSSQMVLAQTQLSFSQQVKATISDTNKHWYRLPDNHQHQQLTVYIETNGNKVYYPEITLYNQYNQPTRVIRSPINIEAIAPYKTGFKVIVPFSPNDEFFTIHMPKQLIGQTFMVAQQGNQVTPVYIGGDTAYVATATTNQQQYIFDAFANIEIVVPGINQFYADYNQQGWLFEFGVKFGGDFVANNPGGDNYRAGGGAELLIGYDWSPKPQSALSLQALAGFRYQGAKLGKGKNEAYTVKLQANYELEQYAFGIAMQGDINSITHDEFGNQISYENVWYPQVYGEWKMSDSINFTLAYQWAELEADTGQLYQANQWFLGMKMFPRW